ncbi:LINE-1 reverse transcriptase-like [Vitis vinifera]|uniref:LINE-1 reverse transcriptase-like n=1 Tax=Vitis vinifera TaxID=29760 RepID=A0A438E9M7_VITVI|nr:LINE-1 reverse transcriptase-like [Vitis vinifera]
MVNAHSRRNWLSKLKVNGCWHTEENDLKDSAVGSFHNLYSEEGGWHPCIDGLTFMGLDSSEAERLELTFSKEEVFAALSNLGKDKAPGPNGFTMAFWLFCWDVVKKGGAKDMKDFRPISLVGSLYKLLAKVLANKLKKAMDSRLKSNEGDVLCKLDIEKVYDHVNWKFLFAVLRKMGFREKWIKWIEWCISTVKFSVVVNGSPSGFFQSSRGLRQGDPLSPYLFVIVMEVFSCLLRRAIGGGYLSGWRVRGRSGEEILISHLLFVDDTLVFYEASQDQMTYLSRLLMWFEACSGLRINLEKSKLILMGRVHNIEDLALELGVKWVVSPPAIWVCLWGAPFKSVAVWDGVEERFRKRLAMWKRRYISKGRRLTLIRSTLSSMSIYFMSLFCMSRKVRLILEKIQKDFIWGGGALVQKPHLVSSLKQVELAISQWKRGFWKKVISHKYGEEDRGWRSRAVSERYGVGLWKAIRKEWIYLSGRKFGCRMFGTLMIQAFKVHKEVEDRVIWTASRCGTFLVKSLYSILEPEDSPLFPSSSIWRASEPLKMAFFAWEASWGSLNFGPTSKEGALFGK